MPTANDCSGLPGNSERTLEDTLGLSWREYLAPLAMPAYDREEGRKGPHSWLSPPQTLPELNQTGREFLLHCVISGSHRIVLLLVLWYPAIGPGKPVAIFTIYKKMKHKGILGELYSEFFIVESSLPFQNHTKNVLALRHCFAFIS